MNYLTLYGKPGCHLCQVMKGVIEEVGGRRPIQLREINILDDPADYQRYRHDIPVLLLAGREIARHRLTVRLLEEALDGEGK